MFWVYVLENTAGQFYIGQTTDVEARLASHNRTGATSGKFTRTRGPWRLIWKEERQNRTDAILRERQIKRMKSSRWIRDNLLDGGGRTAGIEPGSSASSA